MTDAAELNEAPRPQHLIITVFGMYARERGGTLAIAELIALMSPLGVEDGAVRSSVSRLKRRGVLVSTRKGDAAAYRLSDSLEEVFKAGDRRIFEQPRAALGDPWLLASFSIPERERPLRHRLRTILTRLGFGQVSGGLWIAPGLLIEESRSALSRAGLSEYVELFLGQRISDEPLDTAIRHWWDFEELETYYRTFLDANRNATARPMDDRSSFAAYVMAITQWRRLPYLEPGIPSELLPADWAGSEAEALFASLCRDLVVPANRFVNTQLGDS